MKMPVALTVSMKIPQICKARQIRESGGMHTDELLYFRNCHVGIRLTWNKQWDFQTIFEFVLKTAQNPKTFLKHKGGRWLAKWKPHLCFHTDTNGTTQINVCSVTDALPQHQPQEMLSHTSNTDKQNLPLGGHISRSGGSGRRGQNFMEGTKEGRNVQVVNFSCVFAKWRVLSAMLLWDNWKAELPKFNSCDYGLSCNWEHSSQVNEA